MKRLILILFLLFAFNAFAQQPLTLQQALDSLHHYKVRHKAQTFVIQRQWAELDKYKLLYLQADSEMKILKIALRKKDFELQTFKEMVRQYMIALPDSINY